MYPQWFHFSAEHPGVRVRTVASSKVLSDTDIWAQPWSGTHGVGLDAALPVYDLPDDMGPAPLPS